MKRRTVRQHQIAARIANQMPARPPLRAAERALERTDPAVIVLGMWEDLKQGVKKVVGLFS